MALFERMAGISLHNRHIYSLMTRQAAV